MSINSRRFLSRQRQDIFRAILRCIIVIIQILQLSRYLSCPLKMYHCNSVDIAGIQISLVPPCQNRNHRRDSTHEPDRDAALQRSSDSCRKFLLWERQNADALHHMSRCCAKGMNISSLQIHTRSSVSEKAHSHCVTHKEAVNKQIFTSDPHGRLWEETMRYRTASHAQNLWRRQDLSLSNRRCDGMKSPFTEIPSLQRSFNEPL